MYKRAHFDIGQSSGGGVSGDFEVAGPNTYTVNIGFTPKYICITRENSYGVDSVSVYNDDRTSQKATATSFYGSSRFENYDLPHTGYDRIVDITEEGFTVRGTESSSTAYYRYFAMP